jgi:hypothetical protein
MRVRAFLFPVAHPLMPRDAGFPLQQAQFPTLQLILAPPAQQRGVRAVAHLEVNMLAPVRLVGEQLQRGQLVIALPLAVMYLLTVAQGPLQVRLHGEDMFQAIFPVDVPLPIAISPGAGRRSRGFRARIR